jgi:hypothetical protein
LLDQSKRTAVSAGVLLAVVDNGQAIKKRQEIPWKPLLPPIAFLGTDGKSFSLF